MGWWPHRMRLTPTYERHSMSAEDNKTIIRRVYDEAINNGNFIIVNESFTDDYIYRSPGSPEFHGPDGFKQLVTTYRTAFPDLHIQLDELIVEATRW